MFTKILTALGAVLALAVTTSLAMLLVATHLTTKDMPFGDRLECWIAPDADCVLAELLDLEAQRAAAQDELERVKALRGADAVRTASSDLGGFYAYVSAVYDDPRLKTGLQTATCVLAKDIGGPDHEIPLANLVDGRIVAEPSDHALMQQIGVTQSDLATAHAACPWPTVS